MTLADRRTIPVVVVVVVASKIAQSPLKYALGIFLGAYLLFAVAFSLIENVGLFDAFYWGWTTATSTGYGDVLPVSWTSRLLAMMLMFLGITTLAIFTAAIAAKIVQVNIENSNLTPDLHDDFDDVIVRVQKLKAIYESDECADDEMAEAARAVVNNPGDGNAIARLSRCVTDFEYREGNNHNNKEKAHA